MVYITSRRYTPRPSGETEIKIYSTCDSVALSVNGVPLGVKTSSDKIFLWNSANLLDGSNKVEAVGYTKGKKVQDSCEWVGKKRDSGF
jgi:beta-galactosidase